MPIQQGQCTVFKKNCLSGLENFAVSTPYTYKIALYTAFANLGPNTLNYTSSNEVTGTGYTAGGAVLTPIPPATNSDTAYISFEDISWDPAVFTARGALIYNYTTGSAVAVLDFGSDKTSSNVFTIAFPTASASTAIIRFN